MVFPFSCIESLVAKSEHKAERTFNDGKNKSSFCFYLNIFS